MIVLSFKPSFMLESNILKSIILERRLAGSRRGGEDSVQGQEPGVDASRSEGGERWATEEYIYIYIYIYVEREREREREIYTYVYIYIYIHLHIHIHVHIHVYIANFGTWLEFMFCS